MYLLVKGTEIHECNSISEVIDRLDIRISNKGEITFHGVKDTVSYNMNQYTIHEAFHNFIVERLNKLYGATGVRIYKAELL